MRPHHRVELEQFLHEAEEWLRPAKPADVALAVTALVRFVKDFRLLAVQPGEDPAELLSALGIQYATALRGLPAWALAIGVMRISASHRWPRPPLPVEITEAVPETSRIKGWRLRAQWALKHSRFTEPWRPPEEIAPPVVPAAAPSAATPVMDRPNGQGLLPFKATPSPLAADQAPPALPADPPDDPPDAPALVTILPPQRTPSLPPLRPPGRLPDPIPFPVPAVPAVPPGLHAAARATRRREHMLAARQANPLLRAGMERAGWTAELATG